MAARAITIRMGTKNNPGDFDCYANAHPDEPMFVLLGRDPTAPLVVAFWIALKQQMVKDGTSSTSRAKAAEASDCARAMERWAREHAGKDPAAALDALVRLAAGDEAILGALNEALLGFSDSPRG